MPGLLPNTTARYGRGVATPAGANRRDFASLCAMVQWPGATCRCKIATVVFSHSGIRFGGRHEPA